MNTEDVVLKEVAPVRVAELTGIATSYEGKHIGPVIQPLYPELFRRLDAAKVAVTGPGIAYYEPAPGDSGEADVVHAGSVARRVPLVDLGDVGLVLSTWYLHVS